jgi:hypothetical protein
MYRINKSKDMKEFITGILEVLGIGFGVLILYSLYKFAQWLEDKIRGGNY